MREEFNKKGYLFVKDLVDPQELTCEVPLQRGLLDYHGSLEKVSYGEIETQVEGSLSRYNYPPYKKIHYKVKNKLESIIGEDLYPTYYYDRFYFPGQELTRHTDRHSCEISVSIHIRTNLKDPWFFWVRGADSEDGFVDMDPGDGLIYKGCERPHWREPMPGVKRNKLRKLLGKEELFYHQVFFHHVLANGTRAHHAWDMVNKSKMVRQNGCRNRTFHR